MQVSSGALTLAQTEEATTDVTGANTSVAALERRLKSKDALVRSLYNTIKQLQKADTSTGVAMNLDTPQESIAPTTPLPPIASDASSASEPRTSLRTSYTASLPPHRTLSNPPLSTCSLPLRLVHVPTHTSQSPTDITYKTHRRAASQDALLPATDLQRRSQLDAGILEKNETMELTILATQPDSIPGGN